MKAVASDTAATAAGSSTFRARPASEIALDVDMPLLRIATTSRRLSRLPGQHLVGDVLQDLPVQDPTPLAEHLAAGVDENGGGHTQHLVLADHVFVDGVASGVGDIEVRQQDLGVVLSSQAQVLPNVDAQNQDSVLVLIVEGLEVRHLCAARGAEARPRS